MKEIMTAQELAKYLHLSVKTIYKYVNAGIIPALRVGKLWRFKKSVIDEKMTPENSYNI